MGIMNRHLLSENEGLASLVAIPALVRPNKSLVVRLILTSL